MPSNWEGVHSMSCGFTYTEPLGVGSMAPSSSFISRIWAWEICLAGVLMRGSCGIPLGNTSVPFGKPTVKEPHAFRDLHLRGCGADRPRHLRRAVHGPPRGP